MLGLVVLERCNNIQLYWVEFVRLRGGGWKLLPLDKKKQLGELRIHPLDLIDSMMYITKALLLIAIIPFLTSALEDGFTCPKFLPSEFVKDPNPKFPHPTNCQKYYVCLKGVTPVELSCYPGEVFNNNSKQCDLPENVRECIDWYKDHPADDIDAVVAPKFINLIVEGYYGRK